MKSLIRNGITLILPILIIIVMVLSCSGCADEQKQSSGTTEIISETFNVISYAAKESTDNKRIYFKYPQFPGDSIDIGKRNDLIADFIESELQRICNGGFQGKLQDVPENWEWDNNDYALQAIKIDYTITRSNPDYFSVVFKGLYSEKTASHPVNYFNSLTIDMKANKVISLSDLYKIDMNFLELFREEFKEQIRAGLAEKLEVEIKEIPESVEMLLSLQNDQLLLQDLIQTDKTDCQFHSFLTDTALGISVPLEHALGDHFEVMIDYRQSGDGSVNNTGDGGLCAPTIHFKNSG